MRVFLNTVPYLPGIAHRIMLREIGAKIFATRTGRTERFTLDGRGVEIGELLAVESLERATGIVGIKLASDTRPFEELGGSRRGGLSQR